MEANDDIVLGTRSIWDRESAFGLSVADRRHHVYCVGKSGTGKSTMLENMAVQDIDAGRGVAFLDPHGGSALSLLDKVPRHRI